MNALVWRGGDEVRLEERAAREPAAGEALVRVAAAGICATDLHIMSGRLRVGAPPKVFGHELAGTVEAVGEGVDGTWRGRRVAVDPMIACGVCAFCRARRTLLCRAGGELGTTGGDGGYSEYVTVPVTNLHALPPALGFDEAALIEPLDCTLGAFKRAAPQAGESALVLGSGPAGLLFLMLARAARCAPIVVVGGGDVRLALARRLGATAVLDHRDPDVERQVRDLLGDGADVAIEASGRAAAQAFASVKRGGRVVLYGLSGAGAPNVDSDAIVSNDLTVVTGIGDPSLWGEAIELAASGAVPLGALVSHRFRLGQIDDALAAARDEHRAVKVLLRPEGEEQR